MSDADVSSGPIPFAGNDYLGLARDPRLVETLAEAARTYGISSTSSRWALGWTEAHESLEQGLADFFGVEAACIMGATFHGGPAYFEVMAQRAAAGHLARVAFCDEHAHANLFLGMRAHGFEIRTFTHLDAADLARHLKVHTGAPPVVATDGVCSISGELPPLAEYAAAAREARAELLIDDAHGVFAVGPTGRGAPEACGVAPGTFTIMGSMSKALGCNGGFIAGRRAIIEPLRRTPPACGTAIPPPAIAATAVRALAIVREDPSLRRRMETVAARMRASLAGVGISVVCERTPIVAMMLRDEPQARAMAEHLLAHGMRVPYFKYASEPRHNLLRAAARASYTDAQLDGFDAALQAWKTK